MAKDRRKLIHIHSSLPDKQPTPNTLEPGELAVNNAAGEEFISLKNSDNKVVRISTDKTMIDWMEKKTPIIYRGEVTNVDLTNNKSDIVLKYNQVVAGNTAKHDSVNGAKDEKGNFINPSEDGGVTDGAGVLINMDRYAMMGGNSVFKSITATAGANYLKGSTFLVYDDNKKGGVTIYVPEVVINTRDDNGNFKGELTINAKNAGIHYISSLTTANSATTIIGDMAETHVGRAITTIGSANTIINSGEYNLGNNYVNIGSTTGNVSMLTITGNVWTLKPSVFNLESGDNKLNARGKTDIAAYQINVTSSGDTTLSGKTINIKSPDTTINGTNFTVAGTNTVISSCDRISTYTDNLTIGQCTTGGSATVKSNNITLSGSNINASATTKVDINSPYIDISGTTTDISGTTGRMRFGTFSVSGDNISASGKTKASIEAPTTEISGTNLNLSGTNTDISSCGRISASTDNLTVEQCTSGGSVSVKSDDITLSGSTININAGSRIVDGAWSGGSYSVSAETYTSSAGTSNIKSQNLSFSGGDATVKIQGRITGNLNGINLSGGGGGWYFYPYSISINDATGGIYMNNISYIGINTNDFWLYSPKIRLHSYQQNIIEGPLTEINGGSLNITESASTTINSTDTTISGTNLTIDESDVKISGNTSISGDSLNASATTVTLTAPTEEGVITVSSGKDYRLHTDSDICEEAGNDAKYYGENSTTFGVSCNGENITNNAIIKGSNVEISGDNVSVTANGKLTYVSDSVCFESKDNATVYGVNATTVGVSCDGNTNTKSVAIKGDAISVSGDTTNIDGNTKVTVSGPTTEINADNINIDAVASTTIASPTTTINGTDLNITETSSTINSTDTNLNGTNLTINESAVNITGNTSISGTNLNFSGNSISVNGGENGTATVNVPNLSCITKNDIYYSGNTKHEFYDTVSAKTTGEYSHEAEGFTFLPSIYFGVNSYNIDLDCSHNMSLQGGDQINLYANTGEIYAQSAYYTVSVDNEVSMSGQTFNVTADTNLNTVSPATIINGETLEVTEDVSVSINSTDTTITGTNLTINESVVNITGDTSISGTVNASGEATLGSNLNVSGSTFINNNLDVTGNANTTGNVTVGGTAVIEGKTIINDVLNVTGATNISGKTTIDNSLDVTDNVSISGTATINGKATVNNAIDVSGAANIKGETVIGSNLTVNGNTSVGGNTTLGNDVTADTTTLNSKLVANGTATIAGEATINNNLTVTGSSSVGKDLSVGGAATLGSTLNVTDAATLNGSLTVGGSATLNSTLSVANNTNIGNNLGVSGTSTLNGLTTLNSGTAAHVKFTHGQFDADKEWNASGSSVYTVNIPSNSDEIKRTATSGNKSVAAPSAGYDEQTASTALTSTTIENAIRETRDKSVITVHASSTSDNDGILKSYKIVQDGVVRGTIDIPQDFLVKSGSVIVKDNRKYIDLVLNTKNTAGGKEQDSHIYIDVADLVTDTTYSSSNATVSATLSADNTTGLNKLDLKVLKTPGTLTVSTGTPETSKTFDGSSNTSVTVASDVSHLNRNQLYVSYASVTGQTSGVKFDPGAGTVNTTSTGRTSTITVPNEIGHLKNVRTLTISQEGTERGTYNPAGSANSSISITSSTLSSSPASDGGGNIGISGSWNPLSSANSTVYIPTNVKQMTNYIDDGEYSYYEFDAEVRASSFSGGSAVVSDAYVVGSLKAGSINVKDNINVFSAITANKVEAARISADGILASNNVSANKVFTNMIAPNTDSVSNVAIMTNLSVAGTVNATSFVYSSDIRLKRDIDVISDIALDEVEKVKFKQFGFKSDETNRITYGVIAQEVEEAGLDQLVHYNEDGYRAVDYTSLLILKNQLLENKINALTDQINTLMNKVEELEMKTNELVK